MSREGAEDDGSRNNECKNHSGIIDKKEYRIRLRNDQVNSESTIMN